MFQEEQNRGKPNWEHLNDELHVLITVEDTENRATLKLERAVDEVKKLLTVVSRNKIISMIQGKLVVPLKTVLRFYWLLYGNRFANFSLKEFVWLLSRDMKGDCITLSCMDTFTCQATPACLILDVTLDDNIF